MILIKQNGIETRYADESAYLAATQQLPSALQKKSKDATSCCRCRVQRMRQRESVLRVYFKMILRHTELGIADSPVWGRVEEISQCAPTLTERVAKEYGVDLTPRCRAVTKQKSAKRNGLDCDAA